MRAQEDTIRLITLFRNQRLEPAVITLPAEWFMRLETECLEMLAVDETRARSGGSFQFMGVRIHCGLKALSVEFFPSSPDTPASRTP